VARDDRLPRDGACSPTEGELAPFDAVVFAAGLDMRHAAPSSARGTLPIEHTKLTTATWGPMIGPQNWARKPSLRSLNLQ
jgi:hypothetical protein